MTVFLEISGLFPELFPEHAQETYAR